MSGEPDKDPRSVAIEQLEAFGMSAYAARTFVTLVELGHGTAREVSETSEVPRTRVYDAVEELRERGLVDVKHVSPREFLVVSVDTARRTFEREMTSRIDAMADALRELQPVERPENREGVWTVDGTGAVNQRVLGFLSTAEEDIVYATSENTLPIEIVEGFREARERGVSVRFASESPSLEQQIREAVPGVDISDSNGLVSAIPAGRFLIVDGESTLVSVRNPGEPSATPDEEKEVAIWGKGTGNNLVVVLKSIIDGDQLSDDVE